MWSCHGMSWHRIKVGIDLEYSSPSHFQKWNPKVPKGCFFLFFFIMWSIHFFFLSVPYKILYVPVVVVVCKKECNYKTSSFHLDPIKKHARHGQFLVLVVIFNLLNTFTERTFLYLNGFLNTVYMYIIFTVFIF